MWSALRTDLTEFVNTVKGETAEALNQIDASFPESNEKSNDEPSPAEEEALRRMDLEETYTTPVISDKKEDDAKSDDAQERAEGIDDEDDKEEDEDAKEFVASFSIDSKTDEIALLLDLHPQTLKAHFERLVPTTVKYEDFWMRYFYRCDAERIQAEWDAEDEAAQQARAQAMQQGLSTVRNFLGGTFKAVVGEEGEHSRASEGGGIKMTANQAAKVTSGYFGSAGRPPFVMNTAVSEDELDADEEDEELGWDDDEEDFEQDEEGNEESVDTEQIEFKDAVTEKLQDELKQALAERDSLQQTVELQQKEIASLKEGGGGVSNEDVEKLETQLFEKDSEIAAIRASMMDSSRNEGDGTDQKAAGLETEVQRLTAKLGESETEKADAVTKYEKAQEELDQKLAELDTSKNALAAANAENEALAKEVSDLKEKALTLETDNTNFQDALRTAREKTKQAQCSESDLASLKGELEKVKAELAASEQRNGELDSELQKTNEALRQSKIEDEAKSVDSPDTVSTGIKIEPPAVEKLDEEAALEDGWGDLDW